MPYKSDKSVSDATRPLECGPAQAEGHTASSLPLLDSARERQSQQQINAVGLNTGATS